jgi:tetratricopeptide (TPR) repeat protein
MLRTSTFFCSALSLGFVFFNLFSSAHAQDFRRMAEKGKILLERQLYTDAIQELYPASQTPEGKQNAEVHYHLGLAYYRTAIVDRAVAALKRSVAIASTGGERQRAALLLEQIKQLFAKVQITLEVDPDELGKIAVQLEPNEPFSNLQKRRVHASLAKRWKRGVLFKTAAYFLPKGTYRFGMQQPACLRYGFFLNNQALKTLEVADATVQLVIKDKPSCVCEGGQVLKQDAKKRYCTCPEGTLWSQRENRCEIPKNAAAAPSWISKNWPWVTALTVVVVAAGVTVPVLLVMNNNSPQKVEFSKGFDFK